MSLRSNFAIATVAALVAVPTLACAQESVSDPREYCDHVAELLADNEIEKLADDIIAHSIKGVIEPEVRAAIAGFSALPAKVGPLRKHEHVSEWVLGNAYVRHYYAFIYEGTPFFLKCTMYKPDDNWLVADFQGNADPYKIGFTQ